MKKNILLLYALLFIFHSHAQHLNYPDSKEGDILINEVQVTAQTNCSYWETLGWNAGNDGGGYCGIQYASGKQLFIYAIWDPSNHQAIKSVYSYPKATVESFGGEGTGLHYLENGVSGGWKLNTWVKTVTRRWDYNGHSYFGYWSYDYGTKKWIHHVTMDFPMPSIKFNSYGSNSFLEDFCGSPANYRKGLYANGYKRGTDGKWIAFKTAKYGGNSAAASDAVANGGVENGSFFMEFGGSTTKKVTNGQTLSINIPDNPVLTIGQLLSVTASYKQDSVTVSWITDETKSPQFSYTIKLINNAGVTMLTKTDIVPHLRKLTFSTKDLANGSYTIRASILDIFDQVSAEMDKTVMIGPTGLNELQRAPAISVYPNPCNQSLYLSFDETQHREWNIFIYDMTGRNVLNTAVEASGNKPVDVSGLAAGIYFIQLFNEKDSQFVKLIKEDNQ